MAVGRLRTTTALLGQGGESGSSFASAALGYFPGTPQIAGGGAPPNTAALARVSIPAALIGEAIDWSYQSRRVSGSGTLNMKVQFLNASLGLISELTDNHTPGASWALREPAGTTIPANTAHVRISGEGSAVGVEFDQFDVVIG